MASSHRLEACRLASLVIFKLLIGSLVNVCLFDYVCLSNEVMWRTKITLKQQWIALPIMTRTVFMSMHECMILSCCLLIFAFIKAHVNQELTSSRVCLSVLTGFRWARNKLQKPFMEGCKLSLKMDEWWGKMWFFFFFLSLSFLFFFKYVVVGKARYEERVEAQWRETEQWRMVEARRVNISSPPWLKYFSKPLTLGWPLRLSLFIFSTSAPLF